MSNVVDMRARLARPALRLAQPVLRDASAIARYVRSFAPNRSRTRAALELRHWVETTTETHGAGTALELLQFQIERVKARQETCP